MKLADLYARALQDAQARETPDAPGVSTWVQLPKGARFAVRAHGRRRQVVISRQHKPVGFPTEEATFCKHFAVPVLARRQDHGRAEGWYRVSYTWEIAEAAPVEAEQAGLGLDAVSPQLASPEASGPRASHVTQLLAEGERLPGGL